MDVRSIVSQLRKLDTKHRIKFILHFGSSAIGKSTPLSDVDIAVYYEGTKEERFRFRMKAGGHLPDKADVHIFQDATLTVQKEMLQGKVVYAGDEDLLYNENFRVIKEFNRFEKYYNECIEAYETA
ncbi:MAG TPA: nucleotidyltransferase domain-containing protein [Candidatus Nanoarchaeia archaeon]|nr:nucleotidyltransferase domain-containing protein [Candidatus Nanoarchaeia archaeon]